MEVAEGAKNRCWVTPDQFTAIAIANAVCFEMGEEHAAQGRVLGSCPAESVSANKLLTTFNGDVVDALSVPAD